MALYLYEFLYRGRPAGSADAPDYHVMLADDGTDAFGRPTTAIGPAMTPDQAKAKGFGLPQITTAINEALMAENAVLTAQNAALTAQNGALRSEAPPAPRQG